MTELIPSMTILIAENSPSQQAMFVAACRRDFPDAMILGSSTLRETLELASCEHPDALIIDLALNDSTRESTIAAIPALRTIAKRVIVWSERPMTERDLQTTQADGWIGKPMTTSVMDNTELVPDLIAMLAPDYARKMITP